tara:strand:+ start:3091 stop:6612 length:3522 start_codon:yes stop_codon:yes gene_type:complete
MSANRFIKKSTVSVKNSPINTFRFNAASGKRFANEIEQQGGILQKTALVEGEKIAKKNAKEIAMGLDSSKIITTDDEGKPIALEMDLGLGSIGRETFQSAIDQRYVQEWDNKLKLKANEIYNSSLLEEHPNAVFKTRMSTFIEEHVNSVEDSFYNGIVKNIGAEYQAEYSQKYQINKVTRQIDAITVSKTEAVRNASTKYIDFVKRFGEGDPKTIEHKKYFDNLQDDSMYKRLVPAAEQLNQFHQNKIQVAAAQFEKIISYITTSGKFNSDQMSAAHQALGIYSESNPAIKKLKKEHPQIANAISSLYENTDGIGFSGERNKLENATGGIVTAARSELAAQKSITSLSMQNRLGGGSTNSIIRLQRISKLLLEKTTNDVISALEQGDFEKVNELKDIYKAEINEYGKSFLSNSVLTQKDSDRNPKLFKIAREKELIDKESKLLQFGFKENDNKIDRDFEVLKLTGVVKYHLDNSLDKLYPGFTKDYENYLKTGKDKAIQHPELFPKAIKDSIDLIRNGDLWDSNEQQIITGTLNYFKENKPFLETQEQKQTLNRDKAFIDKQTELVDEAIELAASVYVDPLPDPRDLLPSALGMELSELRSNEITELMSIVSKNIDEHAALSTTSNEFKLKVTARKQQYQNNVAQAVFNSYLGSLDGRTEEGLKSLISIKNYLTEGETALAPNSEDLNVIKNVFEKIDSPTLEAYKPRVRTAINSLIAEATPSPAEIKRTNAIQAFRNNTGDPKNKDHQNIMGESIATKKIRFTDDWSNKSFEEITAYKSKVMKNFMHQDEIKLLNNFKNGLLNADETVKVFQNLQMFTTYIGDQEKPFNVELKKIFMNAGLNENSTLVSNLESILVTADILNIEESNMYDFVQNFSNFTLRDSKQKQFEQKDYVDMNAEIQENLKAAGLFTSQVQQALTGKSANFIIEHVANRIINHITEDGSREFSKGNDKVKSLTIEAVTKRIDSEFAPNNASEALITGQSGVNTMSNNNVMSTFMDRTKQKSFMRTVGYDLSSMLKALPRSGDKNYVLAEEYERTVNTYSTKLSAGTELEEYKRNNTPVWITPNFMIDGKYPMFMAMIKDKDRLMKPLIAEHLSGDSAGEISYATWDSQNWDRKYIEADEGGVNDFSMQWNPNRNEFRDPIFMGRSKLSGDEFNINAEKGYSYPTDRDN